MSQNQYVAQLDDTDVTTVELTPRPSQVEVWADGPVVFTLDGSDPVNGTDPNAFSIPAAGVRVVSTQAVAASRGAVVKLKAVTGSPNIVVTRL